ncbi:MAG: hypothetical protein Q8K65_09750 [Alphaproteobacteria bacterium]|nr:hypothetical protein [Alphaproteobacteria bacterium]
MQNQPQSSPNPQIEEGKTVPKQKSDAFAAFLTMGTMAVALGGASIMFNHAVKNAQDNDPMFVMPVAEQRITDMGYTNVRFETFNKVAGKPAEITFTAEMPDKEFGALPYKGEAHCTSTSCPRITVALDFSRKFGS